MKKEEKASISIMKIICVSIILILISGIGVMAVNTNLKDIKIVLQNGYELTVLTSKTTVNEILEEDNIVLDENQKTIPEAKEEVTAGTVIKIVDKSYNEVQIAKVSEEGVQTTLDDLLNNQKDSYINEDRFFYYQYIAFAYLNLDKYEACVEYLDKCIVLAKKYQMADYYLYQCYKQIEENAERSGK